VTTRQWIWAAAAVAALVLVVAGHPRAVVAALAGLVIYRAGTAMLGGLAAEAGTAPPEPRPVTDPRERTVFSCVQCGTEMVLVMKGEETPPRHCGERMVGRTEIPRRPS
jgi:DNA-directed RNA polymerase subunit RPC12/RpoP